MLTDLDIDEFSSSEKWKCLAELLSVFGNEAPHQSTISRWHGEFKRGRVSLNGDPRVGAPKTAVTQENLDAIEASSKISKTSIQKMLHEELGLRKLVSRWILHLLTDEQKAARVNWCQKTLDPNKSHIRSRSVSKKMVSKAAITICLPKFITELRKNNPERRIILHQDNASSHTAQNNRQYLTEENVELLDHPPYSSYLSPNDFFTFPKIKNRLRDQRFQSAEEAVDAFKNAVLDLPANEWNKWFENCFEHMQMCNNLRGQYFEKQ
ncbi:unnamed protein product [Acanthoscelides obtectus]|uniref:Transposase n=1 Tax=Acanthoscelides obtectus TaxID=200917 RepID=A0A9P0JTE6_ACAOB|nr:unnamed protein product [Acanthoscelides obtectus]CAK1667007.1 Histone-lysine N-methyltransferase SETMAR [Acanthoscelides obtectus]